MCRTFSLVPSRNLWKEKIVTTQVFPFQLLSDTIFTYSKKKKPLVKIGVLVNFVIQNLVVLVFSGFFLRKREKIFCRIFLFSRGFFFVLFLIMSDEYHACSCQGCTANTCLWLDFYYAIYAEHQLSISWWSPELIILPQNTYRWNLVVAWKKNCTWANSTL